MSDQDSKSTAAVQAQRADTASAPSLAKARPSVKKQTPVRFPQGRGQVHVLASFNNTIVSITDPGGNVVLWSSAGRSGFKGPKKSTPYAAGVIVKQIADKAKEYGLREVEVFIKGVGAGREAAVRALAANGFFVIGIKDITPVPHNGVRAKKPRRI